MAKTELFSRIQKHGLFVATGHEHFTTGNIYWVDDGGTDSSDYGLEPDYPVATLEYAITNLVTANQGDIIYIKPGHAETLTGDSAIDIDIAGIKIIGLGKGSNRPTFLLDGSNAADIEIAANSIWLENMIFKSGHLDVTSCFDMGAATDFTVVDCEFIENTTNENFLTIFSTLGTANANDRLTISGCKYIGPDTDNLNFITINEDIDSFTMTNCYIDMGVNSAQAIIGVVSAKDLTHCLITHNYFLRYATSGKFVCDGDTTAENNSGIVTLNYIGHLDTIGEDPFDASGVGLCENLACGAVDKQGYLIPGADS